MPFIFHASIPLIIFYWIDVRIDLIPVCPMRLKPLNHLDHLLPMGSGFFLKIFCLLQFGEAPSRGWESFKPFLIFLFQRVRVAHGVIHRQHFRPIKPESYVFHQLPDFEAECEMESVFRDILFLVQYLYSVFLQVFMLKQLLEERLFTCNVFECNIFDGRQSDVFSVLLFLLSGYLSALIANILSSSCCSADVSFDLNSFFRISGILELPFVAILLYAYSSYLPPFMLTGFLAFFDHNDLFDRMQECPFLFGGYRCFVNFANFDF